MRIANLQKAEDRQAGCGSRPPATSKSVKENLSIRGGLWAM